MSLPISIKVEKAIAGYLSGISWEGGLTVYEGHEKVEEIEFPCLVVYSEGSSPYPEMPVEVGVRVVKLRCKFNVNSNDNSSDDRNLWKQQLEAVMTDDLPALQAALNKFGYVDGRAVKGIHFHYIEMSDDPSAQNETDWVEDLIFNVTCELLDS